MTTEKQTRTQIKRAAIIEAARTTFKELGVAATSMDKLAEVAGVSKRTVYNHFATKEALVITLMTDLWQQSLSQHVLVYSTHQPLAKQLLQLVLHEIEFMQSKEHIELARMAIGHLFYAADMQEELLRVVKQETNILRWIKAATHDNRLMITDTELAQEQIHSLIKGQCFWPYVFQLADPLDNSQKQHIAAEVVEMFLCRYQKNDD